VRLTERHRSHRWCFNVFIASSKALMHGFDWGLGNRIKGEKIVSGMIGLSARCG
jgi:hypothetical protein